jgi:ribosomal protein S19
MRASWKPLPTFLLSVALSKGAVPNNRIKIYNKSLVIPESLLNVRVLIHTGKVFVSLLIRSWHIGKRFGQFVATKKWGANIHVAKKGKKVKGKKK